MKTVFFFSVMQLFDDFKIQNSYLYGTSVQEFLQENL